MIIEWKIVPCKHTQSNVNMNERVFSIKICKYNPIRVCNYSAENWKVNNWIKPSFIAS